MPTHSARRITHLAVGRRAPRLLPAWPDRRTVCLTLQPPNPHWRPTHGITIRHPHPRQDGVELECAGAAGGCHGAAEVFEEEGLGAGVALAGGGVEVDAAGRTLEGHVAQRRQQRPLVHRPVLPHSHPADRDRRRPHRIVHRPTHLVALAPRHRVAQRALQHIIVKVLSRLSLKNSLEPRLTLAHQLLEPDSDPASQALLRLGWFGAGSDDVVQKLERVDPRVAAPQHPMPLGSRSNRRQILWKTGADGDAGLGGGERGHCRVDLGFNAVRERRRRHDLDSVPAGRSREVLREAPAEPHTQHHDHNHRTRTHA
eukprot:1346385-Rhodomonas_salina.2